MQTRYLQDLILTDLLQLEEVEKFVAICWQVATSGKIDNLQHVCGIFSRVAGVCKVACMIKSRQHVGITTVVGSAIQWIVIFLTLH